MRSARRADPAPGTVAEHLHDLPAAPFPVDRLDFVTSLCEGRRVLHLGCTDDTAVAEKLAAGRHLHGRLEECSTVVGLDIDIARLGALTGRFRRLVGADAMALPFRAGSFDDIILGEILEHLPSPLPVLARLRQSGVGRRLVVTVPNGYSAYCARALRRGVEVVNPDHLCTYTPVTLRNLLTRAGWSVDEVRPYAWSLPRSPRVLAPRLLGGVAGDRRAERVRWRTLVGETRRWRHYRAHPFTGDGLIAVAH